MAVFPVRNVVHILFSFALIIACPASAQDVLNGVAAIVNSEVITFSQVRELVGAREQALQNSGVKGKELVEKTKEIRLAAINDLVDRQLVLQEFKKNKFNIPDYVVEDHVQTIIREEFKGDRRAFIRTLEAQGYSMNRFRALEKEKIIVQAMRQKNVRSDVLLPPHRIEEYYQKHRQEFSTADQIKLRMISVKKNESGGKETMIGEIRSKIADGADFAKMAEMYSEDSTKSSGGDWGWIDRNTLNEELTRIAFSLKPGEVSKVTEVSGNYYLLFVEARKNATVKPLNEVRSEIEKKLVQQERQKLQQKWIESLRKKAYIKIYS